MILAYPNGPEELAQTPLASAPAWPGISCFSGSIRPFPLVPSHSLNLKLGIPFLPFFSSASSSVTSIPKREEICAKLAAVMRACAIPETKRQAAGHAGIHARWASIEENGAGDLVSPALPCIWPAPVLQDLHRVNEGRSLCSVLLSYP